jgi:hypothetical protein
MYTLCTARTPRHRGPDKRFRAWSAGTLIMYCSILPPPCRDLNTACIGLNYTVSCDCTRPAVCTPSRFRAVVNWEIQELSELYVWSSSQLMMWWSLIRRTVTDLGSVSSIFHCQGCSLRCSRSVGVERTVPLAFGREVQRRCFCLLRFRRNGAHLGGIVTVLSPK